jgi:hypothetical protein
MFGRKTQDSPDEAFDKAAAKMREFGKDAAQRIKAEVAKNPGTNIAWWREKALEHVSDNTPLSVPKFTLKVLLRILDETIAAELAAAGIEIAEHAS